MKNLDIPTSRKINIQTIGDLQDVLTKELGIKDIESKAEHIQIFTNFLSFIGSSFLSEDSQLSKHESLKDKSIKRTSKCPDDFVIQRNSDGTVTFPELLESYKYPTITFGNSKLPLNPYLLQKYFGEGVSTQVLTQFLEIERTQIRKNDLRRIGCNLAADPGIIVEKSINYKKKSGLKKIGKFLRNMVGNVEVDTTPKIALIIRKDTGRIANPGGMVDSVELGKSGKTAKREAIEEIFGRNSGVDLENMQMQLLSEGYTSDHRNGLFSWIETSLNYGVASGTLDFSKMEVAESEVEKVVMLSEDDIMGKNPFIIVKDFKGKIKDIVKEEKGKNTFSINKNGSVFTFRKYKGKTKLISITGKPIAVPRILIDERGITIGGMRYTVDSRPLIKNDFHWEENGEKGHFHQLIDIFKQYHADSPKRLVSTVKSDVKKVAC